MYLIALILFAASYLVAANPASPAYRLRKPLRFGAIGVAVLAVALASVVQIPAGMVGVTTLFGKVQNNVLHPGLNVINPLLKVVEFDTRTQNYTMSGMHDEKNTDDDAIRVLSADGLEVSLDLTILYKVVASEAPTILQTIGEDYQNKIVRPVVRTKIRDFSAYYDAVSLYSVKRDEFQARITKAIETELKNNGLLLDQVLVRNISLPTSVKQAIEAKINAEQESQKMQFVLAKEKQEAERKRVEAQGIADYQQIINSSLTDRQLQYEMIKAQKELALSANSKVLILGGGKPSTPFIIDTK